MQLYGNPVLLVNEPARRQHIKRRSKAEKAKKAKKRGKK